MPSFTVRNIPDDVHRAIRARAALHGRSTEAEIRAILELAAKPADRVKLGSLLVSIGRDAGLTAKEANAFDKLRGKAAIKPIGLK
ncbi:plasmid stabilization protein [Xanthomonas phaseoli pv. phaseoli]|uniref:Plasmid stability protein n=9 Tax=Xanthomonas TaxID=338 RepID=A0AAI7ZJ75_XANAC|nr:MULTISPECIES: Arc family DNA-binding protein [Xanthomonas]OOW62463.1 plasmid stabilization protein [Xanthomonas campestris pv. thespesiae]OOW74541.1 plasmid stabilization protein [Xanthomonas campestris pv. leeana]OOW92054.1 plasmid stabilization protein [Xanthomonas campestris pv. vitiscarnosae]OOW92918.1 plasmid stabilization protein [Xanthomonas campestris pv. vitistrifoliae]WVK04054.1 Arc family DNA-binding protein [Xanthomonas campestris pv. olitorii]